MEAELKKLIEELEPRMTDFQLALMYLLAKKTDIQHQLLDRILDRVQ